MTGSFPTAVSSNLAARGCTSATQKCGRFSKPTVLPHESGNVPTKWLTLACGVRYADPHTVPVWLRRLEVVRFTLRYDASSLLTAAVKAMARAAFRFRNAVTRRED